MRWQDLPLPAQPPRCTPGLWASLTGRKETPKVKRAREAQGLSPAYGQGCSDSPSSSLRQESNWRASDLGGAARVPRGRGLPTSTLLYPAHSQHNGCDGQELPRRCELNPVVHLLPVGEQPGLALVRGLEGCPLHRVQEDVHALEGEAFIRGQTAEGPPASSSTLVTEAGSG